MFEIQLLSSFFIGGLFIALQTLIAERVSLRWRGIALTIPSTMAIGIFFIGLVKSPQDAVEAAKIIPATIGIAFLYVYVFILLARKFNSFFSFFMAIILWAAFAFLILSFPPANFLISILYLAVFLIPTYLLIRRLPQDTHLKIFPINGKQLLARSLLGGIIIALVTFFSKTLGNNWGGLFSTFPVGFTSTLIIYQYLQGSKVLPAIGKSFYFPGAIGFIVYTGVVILTFSQMGIWFGTLVAYIACFIFFWFWNFLIGRIAEKLLS